MFDFLGGQGSGARNVLKSLCVEALSLGYCTWDKTHFFLNFSRCFDAFYGLKLNFCAPIFPVADVLIVQNCEMALQVPHLPRPVTCHRLPRQVSSGF